MYPDVRLLSLWKIVLNKRLLFDIYITLQSNTVMEAKL